MTRDLAIIGIDSLDPYLILQHRSDLPTFSALLQQSSTFISKSVFPVDTIPAWASIYTGLNPSNHGLLYVYDVFDPNLSDLGKLNTKSFQGHTFWDYAGSEGYQTLVIYPTLMYPPWDTNGTMVSKSPFDMKINNLQTTIDIGINPQDIQEKYSIPKQINSIWGGYPGHNKLAEWANFGKKSLEQEYQIGKKLIDSENWDLLFIYFSLLDIIQHRLWRFSDITDPTYPGKNDLEKIILDYYVAFDKIIGDFITTYPQTSLIVLSDHGHKMRPIKTINMNQLLLEQGYLRSNKKRNILGKIKTITLDIANKLDIEHWIIKIATKNQKLTQVSKEIYSSSGSIEKGKSKAYLSTFAGIKSYSFGGIEINCDVISPKEYDTLRNEIITYISHITTAEGDTAVVWAKRREDLCNGIFTSDLYPDIVFMLKEDYGVGWDMGAGLFGSAHDHKIASGGHGRDAVFISRGIKKELTKEEINLVDVAPTILDILEIDCKRYNFDGKSIF